MTTSIFVTFQVGRQTFALPLTAVQQIARLPELTPIAGAPPIIAGLLDLRGTLIPVLIGHRLLDQPLSISLQSMVMVLSIDTDQPQLGLLVDGVYGVQQISSDNITPLTFGTDLLKASFRTPEGIVPVLDPPALLAYLDNTTTTVYTHHVGSDYRHINS
ncbi:chemotaxis protein CheW [Chloroflexus sp.]|uniref:chemotaxis protein CheW n=1 Tax=Chloroflexus sp. TaxID=1904827 RepID=UPI002609720B|nr:chemotaxis protein CheW [uncultured Chloroflexus sp.]